MEIALIVLIITVIVLAAKLTAAHGKIAQLNSEFEDLTLSGGFDFDWRFNDDCIEVFGRRYYGCSAIEVVIKRYRSDDQSFAIRCAEELIEKLEEKI